MKATFKLQQSLTQFFAVKCIFHRGHAHRGFEVFTFQTIIVRNLRHIHKRCFERQNNIVEIFGILRKIFVWIPLFFSVVKKNGDCRNLRCAVRLCVSVHHRIDIFSHLRQRICVRPGFVFEQNADECVVARNGIHPKRQIGFARFVHIRIGIGNAHKCVRINRCQKLLNLQIGFRGKFQ